MDNSSTSSICQTPSNGTNFKIQLCIFLGFGIIISRIEEQETEYTLTASRVCGLILRDGPLGNWHTDGVPTGAPANACWRSWAPMASFQTSSTIEYISSDMIRQGVFVNTIGSMNSFATSKVALWCWGTLWSPPAFGWGTYLSPPALGSGSACTMSDSHDILVVDFWRLSNSRAGAPAGCCRFGSGVRAMTVLARLHFVGSGTLVVRNVLSRHAWSRCRTPCWFSELSSSISDDQVDSPGYSFSSLPISPSVMSSSCLITIITRTVAISNTILEGWVGSWNIWSAMKIGCLHECTCKGSLKVCFSIHLRIANPHLASCRFHVWWSAVGECRQKYIRVNIVWSVIE